MFATVHRSVFLAVLALTMGMASWPATAADTVSTLAPAMRALGVRMLYPNAKVEANKIYPLIVKTPDELIQIGVDDVKPGDRVMARLDDKNQLTLYTPFGDTSAPIQLAADGSIEKMQRVKQTELNTHSSAASRHSKRGVTYERPSNTVAPSGFGRAENIIGR